MTESDISNSLLNGLLYLEDEVTLEWHPHFFVLTANTLFYTEETNAGVTEEPEDEEETNQINARQEVHTDYFDIFVYFHIVKVLYGK